uniref:alpha-N-acetylgalactosaminide alpha-2,6-sialyltransferase n=1 Tax=Maylandia zebra TaxID=106582 RepID=A0A3P9B663_9CICH
MLLFVVCLFSLLVFYLHTVDPGVLSFFFLPPFLTISSPLYFSFSPSLSFILSPCPILQSYPNGTVKKKKSKLTNLFYSYSNFWFADVMDSVKLIPKPKEPLLLPKPGGDGCVRCAVVGTGGILNGSKKGVEIDGHDYVFRMNGAITKGYEEDVGNKTSVYVHTAHSITTSLYLLKKYGYKSAPHDEGIKYVLIPEGMRDFQWLKALLRGEKVSAGPYRNKLPRTYYSGQYNESRFYVLHQDFLRYVRNRFLLSPNLNKTSWFLVRPTNGAFTVFLALHTCDIKNMSKVIFYLNHDYILEKNTWKDLHNRKIIRLYERTESKSNM